MKRISKLLIIILALFCFTNVNAEENPTITINEALCREGKTYNLYR